MAIDLNPTILGRPLFPSSQRTAEGIRSAITSFGSTLNKLGFLANPSYSIPSAISSVRSAVAQTPLIGSRRPIAQPTATPLQQLSSGTVGTGYDIYPTTPQMAPRTASATAPQPAAPSLAAPTTVPTFPTTGMGLMGNQNIRPIPTEQIAPMTSISRIEGGPASMDIAGPITAEAQGRQPIQTPRGTIYATEQQAAAFNAPRTVDTASSRTPAQQQALLAQMRERGRSMAGAQETFFAQKASERAGLKMAEAKARSMGASSMDIMRAREATQPSTLGATRSEAFGYTQRLPIQGLASQAISEFTNKLPTGIATPSKIGGFNFGNIVGSSSGATLGVANNSSFRSQRLAPTKVTGSSSLYSNKNAEQRQATREIAKSLGMQPALSRGIQQEQEQYFRSRGFM